MFQLFYTYVASVLSRCCICFKHMLQLFYLNVAMLHTYVTSVSSRCYICFAIATRVFSWCFRRMLPVFQLFQTYVASVSSRCCKSRSGVAHVAIGPIWRSHLLQLLGPCACVWVWTGRERQAWKTVRARRSRHDLIFCGKHSGRRDGQGHKLDPEDCYYCCEPNPDRYNACYSTRSACRDNCPFCKT
jgi:hypothetical protein